MTKLTSRIALSPSLCLFERILARSLVQSEPVGGNISQRSLEGCEPRGESCLSCNIRDGCWCNLNHTMDPSIARPCSSRLLVDRTWRGKNKFKRLRASISYRRVENPVSKTHVRATISRCATDQPMDGWNRT